MTGNVDKFTSIIIAGLLLIIASAPVLAAQPVDNETHNTGIPITDPAISITIGEDNGKIEVTANECLIMPVTAGITGLESNLDVPVVWSVDGYPMEHGADFATCRFAGYLTWTPQISDIGKHSIAFTVSVGDLQAKQTAIIEIMSRQIKFSTDRPSLSPEPEYTSGHSNTIYCNPLPFNIQQQICVFYCENTTAPVACYDLSQLNIDTLPDGRAAITIPNLQRSTRYGYYIAATGISIDNGPLYSDTVYSTQDFEPPDQIIKVNASLSDLGELIVSWNGVNDDLTEVSYYELYRRRESGDFILLGTVPAMYGISDSATHYSFSDSVVKNAANDALTSVQYMVRAIDGAGNGNNGVYSELVSLLDDNRHFSNHSEPSDSAGAAINTNAR